MRWLAGGTGAALVAVLTAAAAQAQTPTPMAMFTATPIGTAMATMTAMPAAAMTSTTATTPMATGTTQQTRYTASYKIVVVIGPAANMLMPGQATGMASGEVMIQMPGMPMPVMTMTDQGQPVNHHLEVHIFNRTTGAVVNTMMPVITITDETTGATRTLANVMAMYDITTGPSDLHFGNNVFLADGHMYTVGVTVGSETATFKSLAVSSGMPLAMPATPQPMPTSGTMPARLSAPNTGAGPLRADSGRGIGTLAVQLALAGGPLVVGGAISLRRRRPRP